MIIPSTLQLRSRDPPEKEPLRLLAGIIRDPELKGNHVRLGIKAPKSVPVHREEIYEAIQREIQREEAEQTS